MNRIIFLDFLRIFAALSVLIGHKLFPQLVSITGDKNTSAILRYLAEALMPFCYAGISGIIIFFMISGFIITKISEIETPRSFIIRRVFRIYPLYIFIVLLEIWMNWNLHGTPPPSAGILIPRLLLLGDFFDTPYGLGGVEWTLRIEILYYLLIWVLMIAGINRCIKLLPYLYILITTILYCMPSFPTTGFVGYLNCFSPFLFIGSVIYLYQEKKISSITLLATLLVVYYNYQNLTLTNQYFWKDSNSAIYGILLFIACWMLRKQFILKKMLGAFAAITYSLYLLHDWLWTYLVTWVEQIKWMRYSSAIQTFIVLIFICCITHITIENYGNRIGKNLSRRFHK